MLVAVEDQRALVVGQDGDAAGVVVGVQGPPADQIHLVLNGKPGTAMASFKGLSNADLAAVITYTKNAWNNAGLHWTMWSYKATHGLNPDSWGWYSPTSWKTTPNISTDSSAAIPARSTSSR